jgi:hypothetical protein
MRVTDPHGDEHAPSATHTPPLHASDARQWPESQGSPASSSRWHAPSAAPALPPMQKRPPAQSVHDVHAPPSARGAPQTRPPGWRAREDFRRNPKRAGRVAKFFDEIRHELVGSPGFSTRSGTSWSGRQDFRRDPARVGRLAKFFDETWRELVGSRSFSTKLGASWSAREVFRRNLARAGRVTKFFDETWRELVGSRSFSTKLGVSWSGHEIFRRNLA